jgi:hypothetical protein
MFKAKNKMQKSERNKGMKCPKCGKDLLEFPFKTPEDVYYCEDVDGCAWKCYKKDYENRNSKN